MSTEPLERPDVSVVIPCRDVVGVVEQQLQAIAAQDFEGTAEVLLVDNGSVDHLARRVPVWAEEYGLALRRVDASATPGVSHARNVGLRSSSAPVVAICDADDIVSSRWLSAMIRGTRVHDAVGGPLDITELNDDVRRAWRGGPPRDRLPDKLSFLPYAVGANLAVRRSTALSIGGWDETYLAGGDDVDFCWRLQLAGHTLGFAPEALVHYRYRTDLRGTARQLRSYARCEAKLLRQYADSGARPYRPSRTRGDIGWLRRRTTDLLRGEAHRGRWICRASVVLGRLSGVVHERRWVG